MSFLRSFPFTVTIRPQVNLRSRSFPGRRRGSPPMIGSPARGGPMADTAQQLLEAMEAFDEGADALTAHEALEELDEATLQLFWRGLARHPASGRLPLRPPGGRPGP